MIFCLPSRPGYASVTRIDWMISRSFRVAERSVTAAPLSVSRRWRTSCWVMVDAPRGWPRSESMPAATMPTVSKPALSQNEPSSTAVVASTSTGGISSNVTTCRLNSPKRARTTLCEPVVHHGLLGQLDLLERGRLRKAVAHRRVGGERGPRADDPGHHECPEQHEAHRRGGTDPAAARARLAGARRRRIRLIHRRVVCRGWRHRAADASPASARDGAVRGPGA